MCSGARLNHKYVLIEQLLSPLEGVDFLVLSLRGGARAGRAPRATQEMVKVDFGPPVVRFPTGNSLLVASVPLATL